MNYLNATQAASRLGKSEKTIRRWIAEGRLTAHHPQGRKNKLAIAESDIEQIAQELAQYEQAAAAAQDVSALVVRVNALEQDVQAMRATLERLEQAIADIPARAQGNAARERKTQATTMLARDDIPNGAILLNEFAERHGVKVNTLRDQALTGKVETFNVPVPHRPGQFTRYLTPEQQRLALAFWQENKTAYSACPACPHDASSSEPVGTAG